MAQKQYKFSLSIHDKHNRQVKKIVDGLLAKGNGALSQSIRDGLRLLNDLRRGNITVLLEMFPDVLEKFCPPSTTNNDDVLREIEALRNELRQQQSRPMNNAEIPDTRNYGIPAMKQSGSGVGTLGAGRTFTLPLVDDDDGATIVLTKSLGSTSNSQNLMAGIFGLE